MLQSVQTDAKSLAGYAAIVGEETIESLRSEARDLAGARVLHINATAYGGGVAEILRSLVPLMRDVGIDADWQTIVGEREFFGVTKAFHNALQGHSINLTDEMCDVFLRDNELNARLFEGEYDFVIVHDPQPALIPHYRDHKGAKFWIWRCHIDTSTPYLPVRDLLKPYLLEYDAAVYTMPDYVGSGMAFENLYVIPPSIDPLTVKNSPMDVADARMIVGRFGIDINRPLMVQVSRFDPWKDPLGVIDAYRVVKGQIPEVQLALVGSMASDDPEGMLYFANALRRAGEDYDVHILSNLDGVFDREVNAFQTVADVVIQKSTREGFGLVVSEAMWKGKPVIGTKVGGIPLQIIDGETGYLINDGKADCARTSVFLIQNPEWATKMGESAREHVRKNFLTTRHLLDYMKMLNELARGRKPEGLPEGAAARAETKGMAQ